MVWRRHSSIRNSVAGAGYRTLVEDGEGFKSSNSFKKKATRSQKFVKFCKKHKRPLLGIALGATLTAIPVTTPIGVLILTTSAVGLASHKVGDALLSGKSLKLGSFNIDISRIGRIQKGLETSNGLLAASSLGLAVASVLTVDPALASASMALAVSSVALTGINNSAQKIKSTQYKDRVAELETTIEKAMSKVPISKQDFVKGFEYQKYRSKGFFKKSQQYSANIATAAEITEESAGLLKSSASISTKLSFIPILGAGFAVADFASSVIYNRRNESLGKKNMKNAMDDLLEVYKAIDEDKYSAVETIVNSLSGLQGLQADGKKESTSEKYTRYWMQLYLYKILFEVDVEYEVLQNSQGAIKVKLEKLVNSIRSDGGIIDRAAFRQINHFPTNDVSAPDTGKKEDKDKYTILESLKTFEALAKNQVWEALYEKDKEEGGKKSLLEKINISAISISRMDPSLSVENENNNRLLRYHIKETLISSLIEDKDVDPDVTDIDSEEQRLAEVLIRKRLDGYLTSNKMGKQKIDKELLINDFPWSRDLKSSINKEGHVSLQDGDKKRKSHDYYYSRLFGHIEEEVKCELDIHRNKKLIEKKLCNQLGLQSTAVSDDKKERLRESIMRQESDPNPKKPYKGIGVVGDLQKDEEGKYVIFIKDILSPDHKRIKGKDGKFMQQQDLKNKKITAIKVKGLINDSIDDIIKYNVKKFDEEEGMKEAKSLIAKAFHGSKNIHFRVRDAAGNSTDYKCDGENKSLYAAGRSSGFVENCRSSSKGAMISSDNFDINQFVTPGSSAGKPSINDFVLGRGPSSYIGFST
jgi:hypothetical protein